VLDQRLGGGFSDRDNSPAMSISAGDSPGVSASEDSDFGVVSHGYGAVTNSGLRLSIPQEFSCVRSSSSHHEHA
jgi:hypothetical protein